MTASEVDVAQLILVKQQLHRRLIEEFNLRGTPLNTRKTYSYCIDRFERYFGQSAARLNREHYWAGEPIALGPGAQLVPLVVAPAGVPVITDPERAKLDPELAVLSVMAHGHGDVETAVKIALSAAQASTPLDEDTRVLYFDLIEAALGEAARKAFEMLPQDYEFQGPTFKKGKLEGQAAAMAASVLEVLDARGVTVSDEVRERVQSSTDLDQLRRWVRRAAVITNTEELFDE